MTPREIVLLGSTGSIGTQALDVISANPGLFHGPGRWQADISLGKTFRMTEAISLQVRGEAFNAFNHVNYANPTLSITSPDFGKLTSAPGWRTGQVSGRLTF